MIKRHQSAEGISTLTGVGDSIGVIFFGMKESFSVKLGLRVLPSNSVPNKNR